ncbi:selenocysteine-specific translation elongation factor [Enterocloster citroniae]|uniref:Selenocysteine-specific elongation factor n=2 Tax=Enterocloster citroniae TaxID=358743 RepID=A0AA41K7S9_9FIRM|nr:selenocysteine-specific translation elongation factor [Enterocloster citroniae]SCH35340.1 SelB translation factor [uncultured Clostridium sp.]KMW18286.1 selenocysteine-specific translation elongation factor [[Clostridium] citroniae WAL-19142]MBT9811765.1 selenocysteine-specific translation elongation factor [Enterocloster citroniae]MCB7063083.1 selenocysteine-specific translation elongation factor [Enterocloster citroniae]MCD8278143.1 selenocysteine-specific translation elongation factor [E
MQNIIVGTAGHVDHGKTCLIKALSGFDTDRLKEEKKRGITIDLGFANLPNDAGLHIGIIDVPGHEKFVKNMLAGIGGIDLVLMVIALDEGVMPQTTEHFEILKMLHIRQGILVLTKSDLVDEEWAQLVEADVEDLVQGSFLEHAPVIRVSSFTGENIDLLHDRIIQMVSDLGTRCEEPELFRLPVDRVFTTEGFGTVITGTLQEGMVQAGAEVMVYPRERPIKIRGIQSHGRKEDAAIAGQRTALNLLNVKKEDLKRGDVLAYPGSLVPSALVDVKLSIFQTSDRELKSGDRIHLNYGSAQTIAKAVLMDQDRIARGESAYAQLRFDEPVVLKRNDRFIIRFLSPVETFGGGIVLDASPCKHRRGDPQVMESLGIKEKGTDLEVMELMIKEESRNFPCAGRIAANMDLPKSRVVQLMGSLKESKRILILSDDSVIHMDHWKKISDYGEALLAEYHRENPINEGMDKEEFKSRLSEQFRIKDIRKGAALLAELVKRMVVRTQGAYVSGKDFSTTYSRELKGMLEQIGTLYARAGIEAPLTAEVADRFKDKNRARQIIADMHKNGRLIKLNPASYMDSRAYDQVLADLKGYLAVHGEISLGEFRDLCGTSRKYAVQLLEFMDKKKITKMVGDKRVLIH